MTKFEEYINARFIPDGYEVYFEGGESLKNLIVYANKEKTSGIAYVGNSKKSRWYYRFKTTEKLDAFIKETVESIESDIKWKAERKAKRESEHNLEIGDLLYTSWGYDETHIEFYKVLKKLGKRKIELVEVGKNYGSELSGGYEKITANSGNVIGKPFTKIVNGETNSVKIASYSYASKYNGHELHETAIGYGR